METRAEPKIARLVLRRLIGPIELHDESTRPDFVPYVRWEAAPTPDRLADGLVRLVASPAGLRKQDEDDEAVRLVASPSIPSWNQIERFLQDMAQLRATGGSAA